MNLLVVLNSLDIGGTENYTINLMNQFVHSGHCVKLIVLSNGLSLKDRLSQTVDLCVLPRKYKPDFSVLRRLRREIKTRKYNAVISPYVIYQKLATIFYSKKNCNNLLNTLNPI